VTSEESLGKFRLNDGSSHTAVVAKKRVSSCTNTNIVDKRMILKELQILQYSNFIWTYMTQFYESDINFTFEVPVSTASVVLWSEFLTTDPGVPGSIPGNYKKKVGLERGSLILVSTTEELLYRKVAAPV
jgi:hypothetical protein